MSHTSSPNGRINTVAVRVDPRPLASSLGDPPALAAGLRDLLGEREVFLVEDLHPGESGGPRAVVGFGRLAEVAVSGNRVSVDAAGSLREELLRCCARAGASGGVLADPSRVWDLLRDVQRLFDVRTEVPGTRYAFGFLTSLGYDAAWFMEPLPPRRDEPATPDIIVTLFQHVVWFGADEPPTLLSATGPALPEVPALDLLASAAPSGRPQVAGRPPEAPAPIEVRDSVTRETFLEWARLCLEHIRVGDIYQIQIGHRIDVRTTLPPFQVYRRLRSRNPSPHMYLAPQGGVTLIGASPEPLFRISGGRILMRPIAGTTRRDPTSGDDDHRIKELVSSTKEQAEHVMLVDLCRNDIGRVCVPGTLSVEKLMTVEAFSHVYHMVSTVTGDLAPGVDVWDALCATFPAGTMTGAPKLRAMEIIDGLERERRGPYAGAVGLVDVRGWSEMALCIRTIVHHGADGGVHRYSTQSSAGVVALSDPEREWDETLAKMGAAHWALTGEETR